MSSSPPTESAVLATATAALRAFARGYATGEWSSFLALVAPEVEFWLPVEPYEERHVGRDQLAAFLETMTGAKRARLTIHPPIRTTCSDATVVFECPEDGVIGDAQITNRLALSFDVDGGRVVALREYLGATSGLVRGALAERGVL